MITCMYLLPCMLVWFCFKRRICISCCYAFLLYYILVYSLNPSKVIWHNCYFATFLLCFSLGVMVALRVTCPLSNFNLPQKKLIRRVLYLFFTLLLLIVAIRILYRYSFIDKSYENIRLKLALNITYWEFIIFFKISLFIIPCLFFLINNKILKFSFLFLSLLLLYVPQHRALPFFCIFVTSLSFCFFKYNFSISLKNVVCLGFFICFGLWCVSSIQLKKFASLDCFLRRPFSAVSHISYIGLNFGNRAHTYGRASFSKLYYLCHKNSERLSVSKELYAFKNNVNLEDIPIGASMNTPTPVQLYIDFGWFALFFAFFLGMYLKTLDNLVISFSENNNITKSLAVSYSCCITGSVLFMVTGMGTVLLSGGMLIYSILLILFINLGSNEIFSKIESKTSV